MENSDNISMLSLTDNRIYYFNKTSHEECKKLISKAGNILNENEFYKFCELTMKIFSYDSSKN